MGRPPRQLSLDELRDDVVHGLVATRGVEFGYVAVCRCGYTSPVFGARPAARGDVASHVSRTPAGARVVNILRHL